MDPNHTQVLFSWSHFGFSHITGRFDKVEGQLLFDPVAPETSSVAVTIPLAGIDTGVGALDEHLRGPDFFDAGELPTAVFKRSKVEKVGDNALNVTGDPTIHGVSRPVVLEVTINRLGNHPMAGRPPASMRRQRSGAAISASPSTLSMSATGSGSGSRSRPRPWSPSQWQRQRTRRPHA